MVGLWLLLTWAVCARPGECLKLLWKHLLPPNPLQDQWTVILSGSDALGRAQPSKVGEVDEALMIDQPYLQWLAPVLKKKQRDQKMTDHIFRFDMAEGSKWFNKAVAALKLTPVGITCSYQIRHGSASTDQLQQLRSLQETMKRGRWKSMSSVRRYVNGGRLGEIFELLTKDQQNDCIQAEKSISKIWGSASSKTRTVP